MSSKDWLPSSRTGQLTMAHIWVNALRGSATAWNVPADMSTKLTQLFNKASEALELAQTAERNMVANQMVRTAFGDLTDHMRDLRRRHFFMPPLTEADWVSLGMRLPDTIPTNIGPPTSVVAAEITYPHKNALSLFITPIDGHRYDERADWGFRIYFGVLPPNPDGVTEEMMIERQYLRRVPQNPEELTASHFTRRKRDLIEFPYDNSGKQCFICVRYENSKGDKGPWGPMASSFIP
ncbi:MAG: hypothetical protein LBH16_05645 [Treponema sp.]|nr:hypothetical protein [Treponema sp.]